MTTEYELMHHGILGMKWGVRRYQDYGEGGYNPKHKGKNMTKEQSHKVRKAARAERIKAGRKQDAKDRYMLSDQALDQKVRRLQKEKQLKELTEETLHPGRSIAKKAAMTSAATIATGTAAYGGYILLQKAMGSKVKWKTIPKAPKLKKFGKTGLALVDQKQKRIPKGIKLGKADWDKPKQIANVVMKGGFKKK